MTHEDTKHVKESKINILVHDYEMFKILSGESIYEMFTRFINVMD